MNRPPLLKSRPAPTRPQPAAAPLISAVIVNYRQWHHTWALAQQVLRSPAGRREQVEVVVVDNHSPPHRLIGRLRRWPGVSLRRWRHNRGYARAVNEGCRLSRGDWFLLLNPDITLADDFIDRAYRLAEELAAREPRRGVIGFRLHDPDGSRQLSVGRFPTLAGTLLGLAAPRVRRKYRRVFAPQRCSVQWATGCCLLVRRDCFQSLGGFDDSFFLYYEDVDFCRRARAAGWSVAYEPALAAVHHQPLQRRRISPRLRLITRHALLNYAAKHWPGWQAGLLAGVVRLEGWLRGAWARLRGDRVEMRTHRRLASVAGDFLHGDRQRARRRLIGFLRRSE